MILSKIAKRFKISTLIIWGIGLLSVCFQLAFIMGASFDVDDGTRWYSLFDDSMISMRYAYNLAHGYGLVWNPGESPVEGYTNFLWVLWMAFLHLLPIPESKVCLAVSLTGMIILTINFWIIYQISKAVSDNDYIVKIVALSLTGVYYPLIYWTLRGMEVGLISLLLNLSFLSVIQLKSHYSRRRVLVIAILLSLAILTRTDVVCSASTILISILLTVNCLNLRQKTRTVGFIGFSLCLVMMAHTIFRYAYYGDVLPNTYYLKLTGASLTERCLLGIYTFYEMTRDHLLPALLLAIFAFLKASKNIRLRLSMLFLFLSQVIYSIYVGGDVWEAFCYANRFVTPAMPILFILSGIGLSYLIHRAKQLQNNKSRLIMLLSYPTIFLVISGLGFLVGRNLAIGIYGKFSWEKIGSLFFWCVGAFAAFLMLIYILQTSIRYKRRLRNWHFVMIASIVCVTIFFMNARAFLGWFEFRGYAVGSDADMTRIGLRIRKLTRENTTIAVTWAGAIPYYSRRKSVDILGKCDKHVASSRPKMKFMPGHNKWDYEYSFGQLKPDIIVQAGTASHEELERMGYHFINGIWIRNGFDDINLFEKLPKP